MKMQMTRWDPFRELEEVSHRLNKMFTGRELMAPNGEGREAMKMTEWAPAVDIEEMDDEYVIKAELPEVKREDVKVTVQDDVLCIEGERKREMEQKGKKFHRVEREFGSFLRRFNVPDNVDPKAVKAEFKDGMLIVKLHKTKEAKSKAVLVNID